VGTPPLDLDRSVGSLPLIILSNEGEGEKTLFIDWSGEPTESQRRRKLRRAVRATLSVPISVLAPVEDAPSSVVSKEFFY